MQVSSLEPHCQTEDKEEKVSSPRCRACVLFERRLRRMRKAGRGLILVIQVEECQQKRWHQLPVPQRS